MRSIVLIDWPRIAVIDAANNPPNAGDEITITGIPETVGAFGVLECHVRNKIAVHGRLSILDDRGVLRSLAGEPTRDAAEDPSLFTDYLITTETGDPIYDESGLSLVLTDDAVIPDIPVVSCGIRWDVARSVRRRRVSLSILCSDGITHDFDDIVLPIEIPL